MNILDVAENSVRAGASLVEIRLCEDTAQNLLMLSIADNGKGMSREMAQNVTDPFFTTRTTRKVGLGLPLLRMAAQMTGGGLDIQSQPGVGTTVTATFTPGHIDLMPLGDMAGTLSALASANPDIDFVFTCKKDEAQFVFDTRAMREILGDVPLSEPAVAVFMRDYAAEGIAAVQRGECPEPQM